MYILKDVELVPLHWDGVFNLTLSIKVVFDRSLICFYPFIKACFLLIINGIHGLTPFELIQPGLISGRINA